MSEKIDVIGFWISFCSFRMAINSGVFLVDVSVEIIFCLLFGIVT